MKIAVLDLENDALFEKGDFQSWFEQSAIEYFRVSPNTKFDGSLLTQVAANTTHLIMTTPDRIGADQLQKLPALEYIGVAFTGFWDKLFDQELIKSRKIVVTNCPDYAQVGVAEALFAALLSHYRGLRNLDMGKVNLRVLPGRELSNKILGIIGLGNIGRHVANIGSGFGMKVISTSKGKYKSVTNVDRSELLSTSDIISIHVPKSAGEILSESDFDALKPDVTLINTSGKEKYNIDGLKQFLGACEDSAYLFLALPESDHIEALKGFPNAVLYPLFTCFTREGEKSRKSTTLDNLLRYSNGTQLESRVL